MSDIRYNINSIRKSILHFLSGRIITGIISIISMILIVRYMAVSDYASYIILTGIIEWMLIIGTLGIDRIILKFIPECLVKNTINSALKIITDASIIRICAMLVIVSIIYLAWNNIIDLLNINIKNDVLIIFIIYFVGRTFSSHIILLLQSLMEQGSIKYLLIAQWFSRFIMVVTLVLIYQKLTIASIFIAFIISEWMGIILGAVLLSNNLKKILITEKSNAPINYDLRSMSLFGLNNYGHSLLILIPQPTTLRFLVAAFLSENIVAAFGFISILIQRLRQYFPVQMFYSIIEPVMVSRYSKDQSIDIVNEMATILLKINLLFILPTTVFVYVSGDNFVSFLTGGKYGEYYWLLCWFLLIIIFGTHAIILRLVLNLTKMDKWLIKSTMISLVTMSIVLYLIFPDTELIGLMLAFTIYSISNNLIQIYILRRHGINYQVDIANNLKIIVYGFISLIFSITLLEILSINIDYLVILTSLISTFSVFYILCYYGNILSTNEKLIIRKIIPWNNV